MIAPALVFGQPLALLGLLVVPAVVALAWAARRRARRYAIRFPAAATMALAAEATPVWRRWLPAVLALAALSCLVVAAAKPRRTIAVPIEQASIMLVTDHSGSMQATDVQPTRIEASVKAADTFVDKLPKPVRVGVVAFSAAPDDVQAPSTDHALTLRVIDRQTAEGATATGDALLTALSLLRPRGAPRVPAAIVLLSDGATTTGSDPVAAATQARRLGVPIYTVALGTADATVPNPDPFGAPLLASPDPETLKRISDASRGRAFQASDADRLQSIYQALASRLGSRERKQEITATFAILGLVLLAGAAATGVRFSGRLP